MREHKKCGQQTVDISLHSLHLCFCSSSICYISPFSTTLSSSSWITQCFRHDLCGCEGFKTFFLIYQIKIQKT